MGRTLRKGAGTFSAREMTMDCPKCMAILLTKGPCVGVWIPPMYTYIRVLLYLWNYHGGTLKMYFVLRLEGLNTLPIHWFKPTRSSKILPNWTFLVLFSTQRTMSGYTDPGCQQETEWLQSLIVVN